MTFTPPFTLYPSGLAPEEIPDRADALLRAAHLLRRGVPSVLLDAHGLEVADHRVRTPDCCGEDAFHRPCPLPARWVPDLGDYRCEVHDQLGRASEERRQVEREKAFRVLGQDVA